MSYEARQPDAAHPLLPGDTGSPGAFDADLELDDLPDEEPQSGFGLWFWLAGGAAVVLIGGGVIWMRRRKNAARTELSHASDENWDDWDDLQEPSETESGSNNPEDDAE